MPDTQLIDLSKNISDSISRDVGSFPDNDVDTISNSFNNTLSDALKHFNSSVFDDDGFIKKIGNMSLENSKDRDMVTNVLNGIRTDYHNVETLNHSELLLRRDLNNICIQMPEMGDVVKVVRDSIIECNVSTGEVSRNIVFKNNDNELNESYVKEIEERHNLLMAIKNFIIPNTLRIGEYYIHIVPYSKLFAEIETQRDKKYHRNSSTKSSSVFKESIPNVVTKKFKESVSLYNEENVKLLMESASAYTKSDSSDNYKIENNVTTSKIMSEDTIVRNDVSALLRNIEVRNGSSVLMSEMGEDGLRDLLLKEYVEKEKADIKYGRKNKIKLGHFMEAMENLNSPSYDTSDEEFSSITQDEINSKRYSDIKGCYIKYLDPLRMVPIRMDRRVIGYYYVSTTMDIEGSNPANNNGVVDLSYQHYTKDKNLVDNLAGMIIKSFDKKMLEKNIKLKNEIAEIIMAHRFSEGRLSFIYIPENEVIRFVINEDEDGKGHSIIEPTLFPARNYLMLSMYNMLYTLNNNTIRVHYLKSSGLNKDYAAQIQRTMRKFQSRRITIDDIYSYTGVLNKVGGMGEMVLPAGRNDFKALETDTIEAVRNPIDVEFLEQQRRQALSGTGVPNLLIINAIDEVDFAKTLEMANTRYNSTVGSYKIDFNRYFTLMYQTILKYETDLDDDVISSFRFSFNSAKQQEMNITSDMITNFNNIVETVGSFYYSEEELKDSKDKPSFKLRNLRKQLAKKYLPQLDLDELDEIIKQVDLDTKRDELEFTTSNIEIEKEDIDDIDKG